MQNISSAPDAWSAQSDCGNMPPVPGRGTADDLIDPATWAVPTLMIAAEINGYFPPDVAAAAGDRDQFLTEDNAGRGLGLEPPARAGVAPVRPGKWLRHPVNRASRVDETREVG